MNITLSRATDATLANFDENFVQDAIKEIDSAYATVPTAVVKPSFQQADEEELHTSFEEAISERLLALHPRLDRISRPLSGANDAQTIQMPAIQFQPRAKKLSLTINIHQRITILTCLAVMFLLTGFDLMGLLVLSMH